MWLNRFGISGGKPSITEIQLLLVGGGGATPTGPSAGGGGGGFIETYVYNIKNDWPIIIGKGGFNGGSDAYAGYPTSAFGLEAAGGGTGVHAYSSPPQVLGIGQYGSNSIDGGSGGGGKINYYAPGGLGNTPSYNPTQGYDGGTSISSGVLDAAGAGGGGAGGVGSPNYSQIENFNRGGNGGNGRISTITGSTVYYAPGGGGYGSVSSGTGGLGSYGRGSTHGDGGTGGAGIVIIRYEGSSARATGGSISYISGYVMHTFTANGTFSVI
jgi:hypothetical protein